MKKENKLLIKIQRLLKQLNQREYLHKFGPKKYKLKHHLTALLMMQICKMSFRRIENLLILFEIRVPTYSALCKSRKRIPISLWNSLLNQTASLSSEIVAVDSTGFSRTNPSYHYIKRIDRKNPIKRYAKLSAFFDIDNRKFLALKIRVKPRHDIKDVEYLLRQKKEIQTLLGDSSYDAESLHERCFELRIQNVIKPRINVKKGFYRRKMLKNYSDGVYHQRSLIESGFGSLKRKYGGNVFGKNWKSINLEIYCKAICHNLNLVAN